jgi:hypothetical protein
VQQKSSRIASIAYGVSVGAFVLQLANNAIFALVVEFVARNNRPEAVKDVVSIRAAFLVATAAFALGLFFTWRALLSGERAARVLERRKRAFTAAFIGASIFTAALCEAVSIYGLILFFLTLRRFDFYTFLVLSVAMGVTFFPRHPQWTARAAELEITGS